MRLYHHVRCGFQRVVEGIGEGGGNGTAMCVCVRKSEWSVCVDGSVGGSETEETEGGRRDGETMRNKAKRLACGFEAKPRAKQQEQHCAETRFNPSKRSQCAVS